MQLQSRHFAHSSWSPGACNPNKCKRRFLNLHVCRLAIAAALMLAPSCSIENPQGLKGAKMSPRTGEVATSADDLQMVDDYLTKWDRFATGKSELAPFLRENQKGFEAALTRLLKMKDKRAPSRMVFYPVVKVGGSIAVNSDLGKASAAILGGDLPVTTTKEGERVYFAGDLFFWWQDNGKAYEAYPLFEEWSKRDFAQTVVIPMYKGACKRK
jgi:hypothetical protein